MDQRRGISAKINDSLPTHYAPPSSFAVVTTIDHGFSLRATFVHACTQFSRGQSARKIPGNPRGLAVGGALGCDKRFDVGTRQRRAWARPCYFAFYDRSRRSSRIGRKVSAFFFFYGGWLWVNWEAAMSVAGISRLSRLLGSLMDSAGSEITRIYV